MNILCSILEMLFPSNEPVVPAAPQYSKPNVVHDYRAADETPYPRREVVVNPYPRQQVVVNPYQRREVPVRSYPTQVVANYQEEQVVENKRIVVPVDQDYKKEVPVSADNQSIYNHCRSNGRTVGHKLIASEFPALMKALRLPAVSVKSAAAKFHAFLDIEHAVERLSADTPITTEARLYSCYCINERCRSSMGHEKCWFDAVILFDAKCDMEVVTNGLSLKLVFSANTVFYGVVTEIDKLRVTVTVFKDGEILGDYANLRREFTVYWEPNVKYFNKQYCAIDNVKSRKDLHPKLCFPQSKTRAIRSTALFLKQQTKLDLDRSAKPAPTLNAEQSQAITEMTRASTSTFVLFGPPGTGKTSTLVETVLKLVEAGGRILICAPSNKAADVFIVALAKRGFSDTAKLYRLMSKSRDPREIDKDVKPYCGIDPTRAKLTYCKQTPDKFQFSVVVCTLGSTVTLSEYMHEDEPFTHVIVDEAGQAPEMNIWLAMSYFVTPETRLILAGDPMQLGPVTTVQMLEDPRYGFKTSMLARLNGYKAFTNNPHNMITLTKNYRSHKAIVDIFSMLFYNGILEHMEPDNHDSLCFWSRLPRTNFPVMFHNVDGNVATNGKKSSSNKAEADVVVNYVNSLILSGNIKEADIGIVSPYRSQAALVRKSLNLKRDSKLTVESVEKFQGSERRIILLTAVRNGKELGFLRDPKRLNTALSRAQHLLVVIGHAQSLSALPDWKKFIDYCKSNGSYV